MDQNSEKNLGICRLCLKHERLCDSHIWPAFLYKMYISGKGGQFVDLCEQNARTNRQLKRYWMCRDCEGILQKSETKAASLLRRYEENRRRPLRYDEHLLRFAVSLSWRTMWINAEEHTRGLVELENPSVKCWRNYLYNNRRDIAFFTQHAFLINDTGMGNYRSMSSSVHVDRDVVLTKVGPMIVVGRLGLYRYTRAIDAIWEHSRLKQSGTIGLRSWTAGTDIDASLAHLLLLNELDLDAKARRLARKTGMVAI